MTDEAKGASSSESYSPVTGMSIGATAGLSAADLNEELTQYARRRVMRAVKIYERAAPAHVGRVLAGSRQFVAVEDDGSEWVVHYISAEELVNANFVDEMKKSVVDALIRTLDARKIPVSGLRHQPINTTSGR